MKKIKILPSDLINKIAAGEVVERPASVVKELVENALDAQADRIITEVKDGGIQLVRVTDNGFGMDKEDALQAFERHATSKISQEDDLFNIVSYGFRGEALPSIAAVARVELTTCSKEGDTGLKININDGRVVETKEVAAPLGTTLEIHELFSQIPARLKFLKSDATELGHIVNTVTFQALAHPEVSFALINQGKKIIDLPKTNDLLVRIADLFDSETAKGLMKIEPNDGLIKVRGFISQPQITRSGRDMQYLFVNNRFIRDKVINHAVHDAYHALIPRERQPVFFLFLDLPPRTVDVNVHPGKLEVRFSQAKEIHDKVKSNLLFTLQKRNGGTNRVGSVETSVNYTPMVETKPMVQANFPLFAPAEERPLPDYFPASGNDREERIRESVIDFVSKHSPIYSRDFSWLDSPDLTPLGQLENTYIVLTNKSGLILIDQHAAQERIHYEKILEEIKNSPLKKQLLLLPLTIELSPAKFLTAQTYRKELTEFGFELEEFGEDTILIRAIPTLVLGKNYATIINDLLDSFSTVDRTSGYEKIIDPIAKSLACHASIKAGDFLEIKEIKALITDLKKTGLPYTCPHGRAISVVWELNEIKKGFLRK